MAVADTPRRDVCRSVLRCKCGTRVGVTVRSSVWILSQSRQNCPVSLCLTVCLAAQRLRALSYGAGLKRVGGCAVGSCACPN